MLQHGHAFKCVESKGFQSAEDMLPDNFFKNDYQFIKLQLSKEEKADSYFLHVHIRVKFS